MPAGGLRSGHQDTERQGIEHLRVEANGASFHVVRQGSGPALLLLHGWPEFSLTWAPVMERLAGRYTLLAPDLRGFGDSSKPGKDGEMAPWGNAKHAADMLALLDALGTPKAGIVGHDVGGGVMYALAGLAESERAVKDRLAGLFFFDFVYPGIGPRFGQPDRLIEIWYQSYHMLDLAPRMIGSSREAAKAYIGHFLRHWAHRKHAFDDVEEQWVDNFLKPGNLEGGFAYYRGAQEQRLAMLRGEAPGPLPVTVPTAVRWAEHDPIFPVSWTDRLGEYFADLDLAVMPGVGHYPHREDPDAAAAAIGQFFARIGWTAGSGGEP